MVTQIQRRNGCARRLPRLTHKAPRPRDTRSDASTWGRSNFRSLAPRRNSQRRPTCPRSGTRKIPLRWAEHLVFAYPLWLGSQPAKLKGFLEQITRGGFALSVNADTTRVKGLLGGRSAHLFVTMGMPGLIYRLLYGAFGVRALEVSVLKLCGIKPVRHTFFRHGRNERTAAPEMARQDETARGACAVPEAVKIVEIQLLIRRVCPTTSPARRRTFWLPLKIQRNLSTAYFHNDGPHKSSNLIILYTWRKIKTVRV